METVLVRVAHGSERDLRESRSSLGAKLTATFARNKNDLVLFPDSFVNVGKLPLTLDS